MKMMISRFQKEAYSGSGIIINSNFLDGLKVPEINLRNNKTFRKTKDWVKKNKLQT